MRAADQSEYIVQCIREAGSMYEDDARAFLAEHDAHIRAEALAESVPPPALAADTTRRAHLLHAISAGGRWKSGAVVLWYERNNYAGLGVRAARHDLAILCDSGALVQHDEKGVRWFSAAREGGGRRG
ncbi:hypothetical protein ACFWR9_09085 [Streptomyces sp. NPDC058534]|uniref:hypothetical protein n=1 Tax=Streptomyces sp. NPDC058534 TaxID=3346541 RepID=UPI00365461CB